MIRIFLTDGRVIDLPGATGMEYAPVRPRYYQVKGKDKWTTIGEFAEHEVSGFIHLPDKTEGDSDGS